MIIFGLFTIFLVLTDTSFERESRKALWSLVNVTVEEGDSLSSTAPSSIAGSVESLRFGLIDLLARQTVNLDMQAQTRTGALAFVFSILSYILSLFKLLASYVIIFYPLVLLLFYFIWTSRFFRKNDYEY